MTEEIWQQRVMANAEMLRPDAINMLKNVVNERQDALRGRFKSTQQDITFFGETAYSTFESMGKVLTIAFGEARQTVNKSPTGEMFGHNMAFDNGANITFLASRYNGLSISIPRNASKTLNDMLDSIAASSSTVSSQPIR